MSRPRTQQSIFEMLTSDRRPIEEWVDAVSRLVPALYPYDAALSHQLETMLHRFRWSASSLDCARVDDPSTPEEHAPAAKFLAWRLDGDVALDSELRRVIVRADQLLGRHELLAIVRGR